LKETVKTQQTYIVRVCEESRGLKMPGRLQDGNKFVTDGRSYLCIEMFNVSVER
jgi:hypothetical protein